MDEMANPWQTLSKTAVYENPWILLEEHKVLNPSGGEGIYGTLHFKNKAIGIIPLDENNHTWLVGQYRYPLDAYSWEIPMGGGLVGGDILEAAKRELKEETGLTAQHWEKIMRIHTSNSVTDEEGFVFLARGLQQGATAFEETEQLLIKKLPFTSVVDMVMNGEITDGISIAGILKTARLLNL
ncbi:MAG: NUDIX hydrolase [Cyclobacteriaceae bacterium]